MGQTAAATPEEQPRRIRRLLPAGRLHFDPSLCIYSTAVYTNMYTCVNDYTCIYMILGASWK